MSGFAEQFRQHLTPRLARLCVALARCVAAGVETYPNAWNTVHRYAWKYGLGHLPEREQDAWREWISETLLTAILEAEAGAWDEWLERNHVPTAGARV